MRTTVAPIRRARAAIQELTAKLESLHDRGAAGRSVPPPPLPLAAGGPADATLRLRFGAVHEWFAASPEPPAAIFLHLTRSALLAGPRAALWIGRRVRPYPPAILRQLDRVVFVDVDRDAKLWAMDLALRKSALAIVVADGSGLSMGATRRLQLAAEAGGTMALLWRPLAERAQLSAAATRWLIEPTPSPTHAPRWSVTLLRDKTVSPAIKIQNSKLKNVVVEWSREQGLVTVPADLVGRSGPAPAAVQLPGAA